MATTHDRFVVGLFDDRKDADTVVRELKSARFDDNDISTTHHGAGRGIIDYLEKHGVPSSHSHYYAEGVRRGGSLVKVFTDDGHFSRAVEIMHSHGAVDINRRAQYYKKGGFKQHDQNAADYSQQEVTADRQNYQKHDYDEKDTVIPEIEEQVNVGKQKVQGGGVRVFKRKTEVPVEKHVTLREEHVNVRKENVDRPATQADLDAFKEGEMTLTETSERPVVSKEARVTGEVHVDKDVTERDQVVRETATKTEVDVDRTGGTSKTGGTTNRR